MSTAPIPGRTARRVEDAACGVALVLFGVTAGGWLAGNENFLAFIVFAAVAMFVSMGAEQVADRREEAAELAAKSGPDAA